MVLRLTREVIELPTDYTVEQRKCLVEKILSDYPEEFSYGDKMFDTKYGKRVDVNNLAKIKLDILATYLINGTLNKDKEIMTRYKEAKRPLQEVSFSQFTEKVPDMCGWY